MNRRFGAITYVKKQNSEGMDGEVLVVPGPLNY